MNSPWLLLDIGNTHTVAGVYAPASEGIRTRFRMRTDPGATADELRAALAQQLGGARAELGRAILSSVVQRLEEPWRTALEPLPVHVVSADSRREFELDLPYPETMGSDRLANIAGALTLARGPLLIVDAGTATKFCVIDSRPANIGGAILPGLAVSWEALLARAAKLSSVPLRRPERTIGRTTEEQLQSGHFHGHETLIEGMTARLLREAGDAFANAPILATGGCMRSLRLPARFRVEPDLTLLGLIRYGQLN